MNGTGKEVCIPSTLNSKLHLPSYSSYRRASQVSGSWGLELRWRKLASSLKPSVFLPLSLSASAPIYNAEQAFSLTSTHLTFKKATRTLSPGSIHFWPLRLANRSWGMKWSLISRNWPETLTYFTLFVKQHLMVWVHYPPRLNSGRAVLMES